MQLYMKIEAPDGSQELTVQQVYDTLQRAPVSSECFQVHNLRRARCSYTCPESSSNSADSCLQQAVKPTWQIEQSAKSRGQPMQSWKFFKAFSFDVMVLIANWM